MTMKSLCLIHLSVRKEKTLQNINIISIDEEKCHSLNIRNLCRCTQFLQAQSHIPTLSTCFNLNCGITIISGYRVGYEIGHNRLWYVVSSSQTTL